MIVILDWPPRDLHPNARVHWTKKAQATKRYRIAAWEAVFGTISKADRYHVNIIFYPPNARRRDVDGCLSSIKAGLDGIADGLGINDSKFQLSIELSDKIIRGGQVQIEINPI